MTLLIVACWKGSLAQPPKTSGMERSETWSLTQFGLEHLQRSSYPLAPLEPHQVRLKVHAVSLNYRDHLMIGGAYNPRQPLPLVPCSDAAGEVMEVGAEVQRVRVGDRCCPIFCTSWIAGPPSRERLRGTLGGPLPGTLQQWATFHEDALVHVPSHLSWKEAATLPCAALTAWNGLRDLEPGSLVLLQGTGGVSIFALQLARLMGHRVALVSGSPEKMERARALGAEWVANYRLHPEWSRAVRQAYPEGVDRVIEVGGAGTLEQSLRSLRPGGQISLIGVLAGASKPINVLPILMQQIRVQGVLVGNRDDFEAMNRLLAAHQLRPVVDSCFGFEQAPQALEKLASGSHFGKIVVEGCG